MLKLQACLVSVFTLLSSFMLVLSAGLQDMLGLVNRIRCSIALY